MLGWGPTHRLTLVDDLGRFRQCLQGLRTGHHLSVTISRILLINWSTSKPSARAWKLSTRRWRKTGTATARTSAKSTWKRPARMARALAPRIRYCDARGL